MKNFHKEKRFGGNRGFGGRDAGRPTTMHKAVCSQCGKDCQLPFRPNGNRAVFCSTCFEDQKHDNSEGSERKSFSKPSFKSDRPRFEDKKVFEAVCGNCGDNCLVPFRPFPGKPVFCKKCFSKDDKVNHTIVKTDNSSNKSIEQLKSQIEMVNIKLERILRMMINGVDADEDEDEEMDAEEIELVKMKDEVESKAKTSKKPKKAKK